MAYKPVEVFARPAPQNQRPKEETFAWLDAREHAIFERYSEIGSLRKLARELREALLEQDGRGLAWETIREWLHRSDERLNMWEQVRTFRGHLSFDEAQEIAANTTNQTVGADRLRYEGKKWAAEVQNRNAYGKRPDVQVAVGVGGEWAEALRVVMTEGSASQTKAPSTRALPSATSTSDDGE